MNELENEYKVFLSSGLVIGFQYKGQLATIKENAESRLTSAGITDGYKIFKNSADIGTILVYFTEICYENNLFDQAHLIKDFKQFTGDTH